MIPGDVDRESAVVNFDRDKSVSGNAGGVAGVLAGVISYCHSISITISASKPEQIYNN